MSKKKERMHRRMTLARSERLLWSIVRGVIIIGICFTILQPLLLKISVSLMEERDLYDASVKYVAKHFTWNNYKLALTVMDYGWQFVLSGCRLGYRSCS